MHALMETSAGNITIELYHGSAPDTVANFVRLVEMGHYDGLHFHRVIEDFMIQGGCPHSKDPNSRRAGTGGPGWQIPCEASALGLKHDKPGVFSMANAGKNTGGSQFFVVPSDSNPSHLDGKHTVFGYVTDGIEHIDSIARVPTETGDKPTNDVTLVSVTTDSTQKTPWYRTYF